MCSPAKSSTFSLDFASKLCSFPSIVTVIFSTLGFVSQFKDGLAEGEWVYYYQNGKENKKVRFVKLQRQRRPE